MAEEYGYTFKSESNLKREGDYEVFIEKMEVRTLSTSTEKLFIQYRIREDIEQDYKNSCVFEDIWHDRDNPKVFNRRRINMLLGTQTIEEGTEFKNTDAVIDYMVGKRLIVHLTKEFDDYKEEEVNRIKYYKKTKNTVKSITQPAPAKVEIDEELDLPF